MTGLQTERLVKSRILPKLSGFDVARRLVYRRPVGLILAGYFLDSSDYNKLDVVVKPLIQPLYVPSNTVFFNAVSWLEGPRQIRFTLTSASDDSAIGDMTKYMLGHRAWLEKHSSPSAFTDSLSKRMHLQDDCLALEAIAYSKALIKDVQGAVKSLDRLARVCTSGDALPWMREIAERAEAIRRELATSPESAIDALQSWRIETIHAIGLVPQ